LNAAGSIPVNETEAVASIPPSEHIKLETMEGAFHCSADFSRPDWLLISRAVQRLAEPPEQDAAWEEVAWQWLDQLRQDLGGNYCVRGSEDFLLLSNVSSATAGNILRFAESAQVIVREALGDLAWRGDCGKQPILMFSDEDDYYEYISFFYKSDEIPRSMGVFIPEGFPHIALKSGTEQQDCMVIAHELAHNCLVHLPIPLWLNEGVAQRLERAISGSGASNTNWGALMSQELAERHHEFWNEENIQAFWAGTLFHSSGDAQELSYSLAEVLVHLLCEDRAGFPEFIAHADCADAGQTAALDYLGKNLGDVVATFLGEGNWRPVRKSMVRYWEHDNSQMSNATKDALIGEILERDSRYTKDAYTFVLTGCTNAFKKHPNRHVSAADVLDSLRELAISSHGAQAKSVLNSWGIGRCADFGEIVFNLVAVNLLGKGADDSKEDFNAGYDFDEVFAGVT
jgi:uncharacterized repeat protein (TIGR04138 family)